MIASRGLSACSGPSVGATLVKTGHVDGSLYECLVSALEIERSLPNGIVHDTTLQDWQHLLDVV